jgi:hypothetical protein
VPLTKECTAAYQPFRLGDLPASASGDDSVTIKVGEVAPGTTVVLGAHRTADRTTWAFSEASPRRGPVPSCLPLPFVND